MRLCNRVKLNRFCNRVFSKYLLNFRNAGVIFIGFYYDISNSCVIIIYAIQHGDTDGFIYIRFFDKIYTVIVKGLYQIFSSVIVLLFWITLILFCTFAFHKRLHEIPKRFVCLNTINNNLIKIQIHVFFSKKNTFVSLLFVKTWIFQCWIFLVFRGSRSEVFLVKIFWKYAANLPENTHAEVWFYQNSYNFYNLWV